MIVKMLSGEIISLEGDLSSVRREIRDKYYTGYPLNLINLLEAGEEYEGIDRFLFVDDKLEVSVNVTDSRILDSRGQGFELIELVNMRNGKYDGILATIYRCKNRDLYSDSFVLSEDVKVILKSSCTFIRTPTKYKTLVEICDIIGI